MAKCLQRLLERVIVLHQDDFYKADSEIPVNDENEQDWDCPEALRMEDFVRALRICRESFSVVEAKHQGALDGSEEALLGLTPSVEESLRSRLAFLQGKSVVIVDGFLVRPPGVSI